MPVGLALCAIPILWLAVLLAGPKLAIRLGRVRRFGSDPREAGQDPLVSVVVAARDEEAAITARIDNLFSMQQPNGGLEILVISDGSTDKTEALVRDALARVPDGIELSLICQHPNLGKEAALEVAFDQVKGDIVVLTDATTHFEPDCVLHLVAALQQDGVGATSGRVRYIPQEGGVPSAFASYQRYVVGQRKAASRSNMQVSTSGACSAIWTSCLAGYEPNLNSDLQLAVLAAEHGLGTAYATDAVAWEESRGGRGEELRARARITRLSLLSLPRLMSRLLRARQWALLVRLISLKAARWGLWLPALSGLIGLMLLGATAPVWLALPAGIAVVAMASTSAFCWRQLETPVTLPARVGRVVDMVGYGLLGVIASAQAFAAIASGERQMGWTPERAASPEPNGDSDEQSPNQP
ncbi:MAG: glycosyltransferase [Myxococcales bacterium]|nr:glycosyltransferase [Myxococcales bacterium]